MHTKRSGFHQYDAYDDLFDLLASHPVAPIVTKHHFDVMKPMFLDARLHTVAVQRG
jgi:beta-glucosidase/6-phospho-beta-glucosidase/beta-galactosidase